MSDWPPKLRPTLQQARDYLDYPYTRTPLRAAQIIAALEKLLFDRTQRRAMPDVPDRLRDEVLDFIDRNTDQGELADGEIGHHFDWTPQPAPDAFSASTLRDAVERAEDESLDEGEGRDRHR